MDDHTSMDFTFSDSLGGDHTHVMCSLGNAVFLDDILNKFAEFLRAAGFTYVTQIEAFTDNEDITHISDNYGA